MLSASDALGHSILTHRIRDSVIDCIDRPGAQHEAGRQVSARFRASRFVRAAYIRLVLCLMPAIAAAQSPHSGKLLVATEEVRGPFFRQTVVLLLHYDENGAQGLVINRPMAATPKEVLPDLDGIHAYEGTLYWGGPVDIATMRAIIRTDTPPDDAVPLFDAAYLVPVDKAMPSGAEDSTRLRFFVGYAGWAPGQLDAELLQRSWHVLDATEELVFTEDTAGIWRDLMPPTSLRAATPTLPQALVAP